MRSGVVAVRARVGELLGVHGGLLLGARLALLRFGAQAAGGGRLLGRCAQLRDQLGQRAVAGVELVLLVGGPPGDGLSLLVCGLKSLAVTDVDEGFELRSQL